MTKFIMGMRDEYFTKLYEIFKTDPKAVFITADNGAPTLDQFATDFPDRYFNVGIAEQQLVGMAAGMAFEGFKVYAYAIAPFVTLRCYEQNKLDICAMNLPVVNLGVGAGYAYDIMGPSHHTVEDISIMRALPNLDIYNPCDGVSAAELVDTVHQSRRPTYVRFDRAGLPAVHSAGTIDVHSGLHVLRTGADLTILTTGVMVHNALQVADQLREGWGLEVGVVDMFRLKPVNSALLLKHLERTRQVLTLEEHLLAGGLGSIVAEIFVDADFRRPLLRVGQDDKFVFEYGGRQAIWEEYGLDVPGVTRKAVQWLKLPETGRGEPVLVASLPQTHD